MEIGDLQQAERPRRANHPITGMFQSGEMGVLQFGHVDGGVARLMPRGNR
jgi:hypothetical protein